MPTLTLFCDGNRSTVDFSVRASINEILNAWAQKCGIADIKGYYLVFRSKRLAPDVSFVNSGIPNNATLEVSKPVSASGLMSRPLSSASSTRLSRPASSSVASAASPAAGLRIAVQLPSGPYFERIQAARLPSSSALSEPSAVSPVSVAPGARLQLVNVAASSTLWSVLTQIEAQHGVALTSLCNVDGVYFMPVLIEMQREVRVGSGSFFCSSKKSFFSYSLSPSFPDCAS